MSREDLEEIRRARLAILRENLASGAWSISGGDGTDDGDDDEDEEDDEQDAGEDEDDDEEDDEDDGKGGDDTSGSKSKTKRRKKESRPSFKPVASQEELDRIVERRLARVRKDLSAEAETAATKKIERDKELEKAKKTGNYEAVLTAKDEEIKTLKVDSEELDFYRDLFEDHLDQLAKGLPKGVVDKLMPKNLSPAAKIQWLQDYREAAGLDDEADDDEDAEDDDESEDDTKGKKTGKAKTVAEKRAEAAARRTNATRRGNGKRPPASAGKVPKAEDLIKAHREKHKVGF